MSNPISDALAKVEGSKPLVAPFAIDKPTIIEEPPTVIEEQPKELTLQQKFNQAQEYLETITLDYYNLGKEINDVQQVISNLATKIDLITPKETNQDAISGYLSSRNKSLDDRSKRIKLISESGLRLKDLAQGLKSPIDARLSRQSKKR